MVLLLDAPERDSNLPTLCYNPSTNVLGAEQEQFNIYHLDVNRVTLGLGKSPTLD